jgi:hypothetical protein
LPTIDRCPLAEQSETISMLQLRWVKAGRKPKKTEEIKRTDSSSIEHAS